MITKKDFFHALAELLSSESDYVWEMLSASHTQVILEWRNSNDNLKMFERKKSLTEDDQLRFLQKHDELDRVDLVLLLKDKLIGVFSVKNLNTRPEFGALIGDVSYRNKGIGKYAKELFFLTWFEKLNQNCLYLTNHKTNAAVIASNIKRGYDIVDERENFVVFKVLKHNFK